jgi:hypothetical protein
MVFMKVWDGFMFETRITISFVIFGLYVLKGRFNGGRRLAGGHERHFNRR